MVRSVKFFFPVRADYQLNGLSKQAIDEENNANLLPIVSTCIPEWSVISDFVRFPGFKLCVTTIPLKLEFVLGELFCFVSNLSALFLLLKQINDRLPLSLTTSNKQQKQNISGSVKLHFNFFVGFALNNVYWANGTKSN